MPTRYLKESICTSDTLAQLSAEAERLWYRLLVRVDDFGRLDARVPVLRAACFPLQLDRVQESDITSWLAELAQVGLLIAYANQGRPYLEILTFRKHNQPRALTSKYPPPPVDVDDCAQVQADVDECLQIPSYSESETSSESVNTTTAPKKRSRKGQTKPVDERLANPVIVAYRDVCRVTPNHIQRDDIIATVTDVDKWRKVLTDWMAHGWKPQNVPGQLELYRQEPSGNGHGPPKYRIVDGGIGVDGKPVMRREVIA